MSVDLYFDGPKGYCWDLERPAFLEAAGDDPFLMLAAAGEQLPKFNPRCNPLDIIDIKNQGSVGACQGFSLSSIGQICFWRATGQKVLFSAMAAYILSQQRDGLRGRDVGSTLSGGNYVATRIGFCLDEEWRFPGKYDPREPVPTPNYAFRLRVSKPLRTVDTIMEWLHTIGPVHVGIPWADEMNREVVDRFTGRARNGRTAGGHAVLLFTVDATTGNANCLNSWGTRWSGDGMHQWTPTAIGHMLRHPHATFIGYAPEMEYPRPNDIEVTL